MTPQSLSKNKQLSILGKNELKLKHLQEGRSAQQPLTSLQNAFIQTNPDAHQEEADASAKQFDSATLPVAFTL
eukprot:CAMPEP_0170490046 /NCGR_PEP_ID=MMETSP0208-20121228/8328_1 /TAXON_ID=197538 /ORGANISM="Strombidium inclinatum, Strain S3" /LENGTH=72 /DNA_ID=CAMNT_0010765261 /DNA_START=1 /DNA_END=219 /DNA_ORIENTATION=+